MVITYPLLTVIDDSGVITTGATVTITSVKDKAGADIASHGATVNLSGANVSVDYDAAVHGEAWVVLAVSKVSSTFTGLNAAPAFFLSLDPSKLQGTQAIALDGSNHPLVALYPGGTDATSLAAMYAGQQEMGLIPCAGTVTSASGTTAVVHITVNAPASLATLVGQQLFLASGDRPVITAASGTNSAATLTLDAAPATSPTGGSAFTIL